MKDTELLYRLALQHVAGIGDVTAKKLIAHCGSAQQVFKEKPAHLLKIDGIGTITLKNLSSIDNLGAAKKELQFIRDNNIICHYFEDDSYPKKLKHCIDSPILLFQKGHINLDNPNVISIVGTRKITTNGIAFCEQLVETLKVYNPIIVSGFAYGTDITAHKAAIKHGVQTIGCLAHGLNKMYPSVHEKYRRNVENNGGFFTDFWSNSKFDRNNFLKRNRIIAGLSEATIVVESAAKGGSLVTADIADSYNRDVFAVPGRTTDVMSIGCNNLIKQQKAHLLSTPLDVPYILGWQLENEKKLVVQKQLFVNLDDTENKIYNYLKKNDKQQLDVIAFHCQIPVYKLAGILITLELKDVVRPLPGKMFEAL